MNMSDLQTRLQQLKATPTPTKTSNLQSRLQALQHRPLYTNLQQEQRYNDALQEAAVAMQYERQQLVDQAIDAYVSSGQKLVAIGKMETDVTVQQTLKRKAFGLLDRAEKLAAWSHAATDSLEQEYQRVSEQNKTTEIHQQNEMQQLHQENELLRQQLQELQHPWPCTTEKGNQMEETAVEISEEQERRQKLVNELHRAIGLPEINQFRTFQPLTTNVSREYRIREQEYELEKMRKETKELQAALEQAKETMRAAAAHSRKRNMEQHRTKETELAHAKAEIESLKQQLEDERKRSSTSNNIIERFSFWKTTTDPQDSKKDSAAPEECQGTWI